MSSACFACQFHTAVVYTSLDTEAVVSKLVYTTADCLPHASRPGKVGAGVCGHGLGFSWKLSWSPNRPVLQTIPACLVHIPYMPVFFPMVTGSTSNDTCLPRAQPVYGSLFSRVHHRKKTGMYGLGTRSARIS